MEKRYVIECRHPDGVLDFAEPQPESVFGLKAITGVTDIEMSRVIFARQPTACLEGWAVARWPQLIDHRWSAREKTW